jgi:hypothetical protein
MACSACGGLGTVKKSDPNSTTGTGTGTNTTPVIDTDPFPYTLIGRFDRTTNPNVARFDWSNSRIGARFTGTSLTVNLWDESTNMYGGTMPVQDLFDVSIDGATPTQLQVVAGQKSYPIASNLAADTTHTVWITKRTEAQIGLVDFQSFTLASDGNFMTPPPAQTRNIEMVGDSGVTGYGADANVTAANMCTFTAATENADYAYPALVAQDFNANFTNVAFSGKGITANLTPGDTVTIPVLETRTVADDSNTVWTSQGNMDVVIIDAGGDDLQGTWGSGTLDQNMFVSDYVALIKKVRTQEPHAIIFGVLTSGAGSGDVQTLGNAIQASVTAANKAGDPNVFYFAFQSYDGSLGYGCDYHPDRAAAQMLAQTIEPTIKAKLGW